MTTQSPRDLYEAGRQEGLSEKRIDADDILREFSKATLLTAVTCLTFFGKVDGSVFNMIAASYLGGTLGAQVPKVGRLFKR